MIFLPYLALGLILWLGWLCVAFAAVLRPGWRYDRPKFLPFTVLGLALGLVLACFGLHALGPTIQKQSLILLPVLYWPIWIVVAGWAVTFVATLEAQTGRAATAGKALQYTSAGFALALPLLAPVLLVWHEPLLRWAGVRVIFIP